MTRLNRFKCLELLEPFVTKDKAKVLDVGEHYIFCILTSLTHAKDAALDIWYIFMFTNCTKIAMCYIDSVFWKNGNRLHDKLHSLTLVRFLAVVKSLALM
jgi:hypothetical protein